jgi:hypothetical protein
LDTFWYFLFVLLVLVPVVVIWLGCVIDVIARPGMKGIVKALWVVGMLMFPIIGCLVYLITRPKEVVVTEPGLYDSLYEQGAGEFPMASKASGQYLRGQFPGSMQPPPAL